MVKQNNTIKNRILKLKEIIKNNPSGFTYKYTTLKPYKENKGYSVSFTNIEGIKPLCLIKKVLNCIKGFKQIEKNLFIGGWYNSENKKYYLDLSLIIEDLNKAEIIGNTFKQLSLFNFQNLNCINLKNG